MNPLWRFQLFGRLCVLSDTQEITRFRTEKTGALLAYLAYFSQTAHAREALIARLWPESSPEDGHNSLSVALSSLRRLLEPPGVSAGTVLQIDRAQVRLNPTVFTTDVADFLAALDAARQAANEAERTSFLTTVGDLYRGELLHGHDEPWIERERKRLANAYQTALRHLIGYLAQEKAYERALEYAHRAVEADQVREESYRNLMRLYDATGRPTAALEQYAVMERALREGLGTVPSAASQELREQLAAGVDVPPTVPKAQAVRSPLLPRFNEIDTPSSDFATRPMAPRLPIPSTRFFGREEEITRLVEILSPHDPLFPSHPRLVTLTGPGGFGKTRLAIETVGRLQEVYAGAVWFVALADLVDPLLLPQAIADALGLPRNSTVSPLTRTIEALSRQPSMLALDNFEHLLQHETIKNSGNGRTFEDGSAFVRELLTHVPDLTCLVTSRLRLDLPGEREFCLPPLPVPKEGGSNDLPTLLSYASVQLFVERVQTMRPDFQVTERNAGTVGGLCAKLEGIPLAIELAASRLGVITVEQMLEQWAHRLDFPVSRRGVEVRHRTLQAAIEWSFRLLAPEAQRFFARLSVFRGGWTAEAAEAIRGDFPFSISNFPLEAVPSQIENRKLRIENWAVLAQLRDSSLITAEESEGTIRFRMQETLREFGQEQMRPEKRVQVLRCHAEYFLRLAEEAEPHLCGVGQVEWLQRLESERDNLRAALTWCLQESDPTATELALRLAGALEWWWRLRGPWKEGLDFLERPLSRSRSMLRTPTRARALYVAAILAERYDLVQAWAYCDESLSLYREQGDPSGSARVLGHMGMLAKLQGDIVRAKAFFEEALALGRESGDQWAMADALIGLGNTVRVQGDLAAAKEFMEQGLAIAREMRNGWGIAVALDCLGKVAIYRSDHMAAKAAFEESLALKRELGDVNGIAHTLVALVWAIDALGSHTTAKVMLDESLAIYRGTGDLMGIAGALVHLGRLSAEEGDYKTARAYGEQSLAIYQEHSHVLGTAQILFLLGTWTSAQGDYETAQALGEQSLALYRDLGDKSGVPRVLHLLSRLARAQGNLERAEALVEEALALEQSPAAPSPEP